MQGKADYTSVSRNEVYNTWTITSKYGQSFRGVEFGLIGSVASVKVSFY